MDGIAGPGNVPEIVSLALVELEVYTEASGFHIVDGILDNASITVTGFVELADQVKLVLGIFLFVEFLAAEEVVDLLRLGLLHRPFELEVGDALVAFEVYVPDPDFLTLVNGEIDPDCILD